MVGGGQKFVEDAAVVVEAVVVRKQCPVGGQRVGESGAGVGDDGQAVPYVAPEATHVQRYREVGDTRVALRLV